MTDIMTRAINASRTPYSAKAKDLIERVNAQSTYIRTIAKQYQDEQIKMAQSKVEREDRLHAELIAKQQELINTQAQLLSESRKSKWGTPLWITIAGVVLAFLLGKFL